MQPKSLHAKSIHRATLGFRVLDQDAATWLSAGAGVLTMAAIYLALFLVAASTRAPNFNLAAPPAVAIPNAPDVIF